MLIDIMIAVPMLIFILLGLRDGVVRKLVAIAVLIIALYLGQLFMYDVGQFLSDHNWIHSENPSVYGFLFIYLGMAVTQGLLYKIVTGGYKIGGFVDRIAGMIFGCIEGAVFLSSLLFIFAMAGFPSRETKRDARLYPPIVNIAPQILDFVSSINSDSNENVKGPDTTNVIERKKKIKKMNNSVPLKGKRRKMALIA